MITPTVSAIDENKVIVIGLDGADWDIITPLVNEGKLPNIEKLMKNGDYANLTSTIPSMSPVAWTTFATGKNPGKHGIYSFLEKRGNEFVPLSSQDIESKKIWDITSENDLSSIIINVPMTYPPHKIKGKIISGYLSIRNTTYTYPKNLQKRIEKMDYEIEALSRRFEPSMKNEFLENLNHTVDMRTKVALDLLEGGNWNLFTIVYTGLDRLQHYFWKYSKNDKNKHTNSIEKHYIKLDSQIGKLLKKTDKDTYVIILSDHGFSRLNGEVYVNYWLRKEGYLKLKKDRNILGKIGITQQKLVSWMKNVGIYRPLKLLLKRLGIYKLSNTIPKPSLDDIDFNKTKAFAGNFGGQIYITTEDYDKIRKELKDKLENLKNPKTGKKFFDVVHKKEEIYEGDMLHKAPDLVIDSE
ncbi:MAG: alkaline phosphatase family protein, partial [Candidatus Aenigmatarchaeota archaeon]